MVSARERHLRRLKTKWVFTMASTAVLNILLAVILLVLFTKRDEATGGTCPTTCHCSVEVLNCSQVRRSPPGLHHVPIPKSDAHSQPYLILDFNGNSISSIGKQVWRVYPWAEYLLLKGNMLTRIENSSLEGLLSLTHLDLSNNKIQIIERFAFEPTPFLQFINLSGNTIDRLTSGAFEAWHGMHFLLKLDLTCNPVTVIEDPNFYKLPSLKFLELGNTEITIKILKNLLQQSLQLTTLVVPNKMSCCLCSIKDDIDVLYDTITLDCTEPCTGNITTLCEKDEPLTKMQEVMKVLEIRKKNVTNKLHILPESHSHKHNITPVVMENKEQPIGPSLGELTLQLSKSVKELRKLKADEFLQIKWTDKNEFKKMSILANLLQMALRIKLKEAEKNTALNEAHALHLRPRRSIRRSMAKRFIRNYPTVVPLLTASIKAEHNESDLTGRVVIILKQANTSKTSDESEQAEESPSEKHAKAEAEKTTSGSSEKPSEEANEKEKEKEEKEKERKKEGKEKSEEKEGKEEVEGKEEKEEERKKEGKEKPEENEVKEGKEGKEEKDNKGEKEGKEEKEEERKKEEKEKPEEKEVNEGKEVKEEKDNKGENERKEEKEEEKQMKIKPKMTKEELLEALLQRLHTSKEDEDVTYQLPAEEESDTSLNDLSPDITLDHETHWEHHKHMTTVSPAEIPQPNLPSGGVTGGDTGGDNYTLQGDFFEAEMNKRLTTLIPNAPVRALISHVIRILKMDCAEPRVQLACAKLISRTGLLMKLFSDREDMRETSSLWKSYFWSIQNVSNVTTPSPKILEITEIANKGIPEYGYGNKLVLAISVTAAIILIIAIICLIEICSQRSAAKDGTTQEKWSFLNRKKKSSDEGTSIASLLDKPLWLKDMYQPLDETEKKGMEDKLHDEETSDDEDIFWTKSASHPPPREKPTQYISASQMRKYSSRKSLYEDEDVIPVRKPSSKKITPELPEQYTPPPTLKTVTTESSVPALLSPPPPGPQWMPSAAGPQQMPSPAGPQRMPSAAGLQRMPSAAASQPSAFGPQWMPSSAAPQLMPSVAASQPSAASPQWMPSAVALQLMPSVAASQPSAAGPQWMPSAAAPQLMPSAAASQPSVAGPQWMPSAAAPQSMPSVASPQPSAAAPQPMPSAAASQPMPSMVAQQPMPSISEVIASTSLNFPPSFSSVYPFSAATVHPMSMESISPGSMESVPEGSSTTAPSSSLRSSVPPSSLRSSAPSSSLRSSAPPSSLRSSAPPSSLRSSAPPSSGSSAPRSVRSSAPSSSRSSAPAGSESEASSVAVSTYDSP